MSSNLSDRSSPLPAELASALEAASARLGLFCGPGRTPLFFSTVTSTSDVAARLADAGAEEGALVIADEQTNGRGRLGHSWFSPAGGGLYVSTVLTPRAPREAALITMTAGVALAEGIRTATGLPVTIKWPNDVLIGRRKLAGILAEAFGAPSATPYVILGFGVNVRPSAFPRELADRATSIETELGRPLDRGVVLAEALAAVARRYADLRAGRIDAILNDWRALAPSIRGAAVEWTDAGEVKRGRTEGIDATGALLVRLGDRVERIVSGEVRWV